MVVEDLGEGKGACLRRGELLLNFEGETDADVVSSFADRAVRRAV